MVSFFLPLVLLPLVQFSNQKQESLPMVHSCLLCCNTSIYHSCSVQTEISVSRVPLWHYSAEPRDAKPWPSRRIFLSVPHSLHNHNNHVRLLIQIYTQVREINYKTIDLNCTPVMKKDIFTQNDLYEREITGSTPGRDITKSLNMELAAQTYGVEVGLVDPVSG